MFLMHAFLDEFSHGFEQLFEAFLSIFRSARQRPRHEKCNTFHTKTCFFKVRSGAVAARTAMKDSEKYVEKQHKKHAENEDFSDIFRGGRPCSKNAAKITSRRASRSLPGTPREAAIDQLFAPSRPPGRQQEFLGRPGAAQSRSRRPPGRLWKQVLRPGGAERPAGSDFGAMLASFLAPF